MNTPLISIIVPVYNVEKYLDACVESLVKQTHRNLEIILVNDGSRDRSAQLCDDWAKRDVRIKVIHKPNGGASSARNAGLETARGEYIGFIDSDDYIDETMFADQLQAIGSTNIGIAQCGAYRLLINGTCYSTSVIFHQRVFGVEDAINAIFYNEMSTSMCTKLFARSAIEGVRFPEGEENEEFTLLIPIIKRAGGIVYSGKDLYYYREREGSVTNMSFAREKSSDIVYKNLNRIKTQLLTHGLNCEKAFGFFLASNSYFRALAMEKIYPDLSSKVKEDYKVYRKIMKENLVIFLRSPHSKRKDKVLYLLVLTKLLRPVYKIFYKKHLS